MIHPRAHVSPDCILGKDVIVWQFASVIRGARIGEGSSVGSCAIVDCAIIGRLCAIAHGAQVHPGAKLEDEVFVGPGVILCNDRWPRVSKVDFNADALLLEKKVVIIVRQRAAIGAGAAILPGVTIGTGAMVSACARVDRDVPDYHLFKRSGEIVEIDRRQTRRLRILEA